MAKTSSTAVRKMVGYLTDIDHGISYYVARRALDDAVELAGISPAHITDQNVSVELSERTLIVKYPVVHVYADRIRNLLTEKFRTFSGKVRMVAEVRISDDRIDNLEKRLRLYADSVTDLLDAHRGDWGEGIFFTGLYEVAIDPVKHAGQNFIQIAKVTFEVDVSTQASSQAS